MLERNQPGTVSTAFRSVRPFFRWLVDEDEIDRNPMDKMRAPSAPQNPPSALKEDDANGPDARWLAEGKFPRL